DRDAGRRPRVDALLPRIRITDLLIEVDAWTGFSECFTHQRSGRTVDNRTALLTAILADGVNLGLTRMADVCEGASLPQLARAHDWHIRDETYAAALARLVDAQSALPLAQIWGEGKTSSSDGQYFRAGGHGEAIADVNARHGDEPGVSFYTHVSDQFSPYHTKVIEALRSRSRQCPRWLAQPPKRSSDRRALHRYGRRHRPRVRSLPRVGLPLRPEIAGYQRSQIVFVSRFCRAANSCSAGRRVCRRRSHRGQLERSPSPRDINQIGRRPGFAHAEEAVRVSAPKRTSGGAEGHRPDRTVAVHARLVQRSRVASAHRSWPQQGRGAQHARKGDFLQSPWRAARPFVRE